MALHLRPTWAFGRLAAATRAPLCSTSPPGTLSNRLPREPTCVAPSPPSSPPSAPPPSSATSASTTSRPASATGRSMSYFMSSPSYRVIFYGSDTFAAATLSALIESCSGNGRHPGLVSKLEVVCPPAKRFASKLRPAPTKVLADAHQVVVHELPPNTRSLRQWLPPYTLDQGNDPGFDVAVVVSFGYFLPHHVLSPLTFGGINVHPSLLPKYRGPCPVQHTLLNGDTVGGVSIMQLNTASFDSGRLLSTTEELVSGNDTVETLTARLADVGAAALMDALADLSGALEAATPQHESSASPAPKLPQQHCVDWHHTTRFRLWNEWRARGATGGLYTVLPTGSASQPPVRVMLRRLARPRRGVRGGPSLDASPLDAVTDSSGTEPRPPAAVQSRQLTPGTVWYDKAGGQLWVKCVDGWVEVTEVAVPGRRVKSLLDFVNGFRIPPGSTDVVFQSTDGVRG